MTVLNESDIEFMDASLDEIYAHRERPINVIYLDKTYDDITGEIIDEKEVSREVSAVVTEISIKRANGARYAENGIEYEQGDIKVDIKIELIEDIVDKIERIKYDGKEYEILGDDKKGIGKRNRYEILGRVIA